MLTESSAKAKAIEGALDSTYVVRALEGPASQVRARCGSTAESVFEYELLRGKLAMTAGLRELSDRASDVYLATDPSLEGDLLALQLKESLSLADEKAHRVILRAVTPNEVHIAIQNPEKVMHRTRADFLERILDRLVEEQITRLLARKLSKGMRLNQMAAAALRLIAERDTELDTMHPSESWQISALFSIGNSAIPSDLAMKLNGLHEDKRGGRRAEREQGRWLCENGLVRAELVTLDGKHLDASDAHAVKALVEEFSAISKESVGMDPGQRQSAAFTVRKCEKIRRPPDPFNTGTLQRSALRRMGFCVDRTMKAAQRLYEEGYITYPHTDSTHLSQDALSSARAYIQSRIGTAYLPQLTNRYVSSPNCTKLTHEAIRPADATLIPGNSRGVLSGDRARLYKLIWTRFITSQMTPSRYEHTNLTIRLKTKSGDAVFRARGKRPVFDGFLKIAGVRSDSQLLPEVETGSEVRPIEIASAQRTGQLRKRFTAASLAMELEQRGISRPSTSAGIVNGLPSWAVKDYGATLQSTLLGRFTAERLSWSLRELTDPDSIAAERRAMDELVQKGDWLDLLRGREASVRAQVSRALDALEDPGENLSEYICEKCQAPMRYLVVNRRITLFCSNRECGCHLQVDEQGRPQPPVAHECICPKCGRGMIKRRGRWGEFLGCTGFTERDSSGRPSCSHIITLGNERGRRRCFL